MQNELGEINGIKGWSLDQNGESLWYPVNPLYQKQRRITTIYFDCGKLTEFYVYYCYNRISSLYQNFMTCCITISAFLPGLILMKYEVTAYVTICVTALCYNFQCGAENAVTV